MKTLTITFTLLFTISQFILAQGISNQLQVTTTYEDGFTVVQWEATKHVIKHFPKCKVLMLTMHDSRNHIERLLKAGAQGYILKNTGSEEIKKAIETVFDGKPFYSPEVTERIMEGLQQKKRVQTQHGDVVMTDREKMLRLNAQ
ncbi:MAG: DNA-binding NarL/FixJ family response regulator [Bacteroidia bacterium]|jgi:DNA-binding NarL/FixJ family response regulator